MTFVNIFPVKKILLIFYMLLESNNKCFTLAVVAAPLRSLQALLLSHSLLWKAIWNHKGCLAPPTLPLDASLKYTDSCLITTPGSLHTYRAPTMILRWRRSSVGERVLCWLVCTPNQAILRTVIIWHQIRAEDSQVSKETTIWKVLKRPGEIILKRCRWQQSDKS